jgi:hypothetical protein
MAARFWSENQQGNKKWGNIIERKYHPKEG